MIQRVVLFDSLKLNSNTDRNMFFLFRSEIFFPTTRESEYLFFLSRKARNIFPDFNIRLYDKNCESDYFFFPTPKSEYFVQQHSLIRRVKKLNLILCMPVWVVNLLLCPLVIACVLKLKRYGSVLSQIPDVSLSFCHISSQSSVFKG